MLACRVAAHRPACLNAAQEPSGAATRCRRTRKQRTHDVTDRGWRGLRSASRRAPSDQPAAVHERLLARPGDDARHDRPGVAILSDQFADLARARTGGRRRASRAPALPTCRSRRSIGFSVSLRHLQSALRRADGVFRGHAGRVLPRAERLAGQGMARQGCAAARLDRDPDPERGEIGRRDRALRQGQALRAGADAGHGRHAARASAPTGRSTPPPSGWGLPSASMPAAPITTRRPRSAGVPITSRITSPRRRRSRPS